MINAGESSDEHLLQLLGRIGALFLEQQLRDNMIVGIGWGTSLFEMVNALPHMPFSDISVVQVIGASGSKSDTRIDGPDLAAFLASKLNASHQFLHAPLFLDSVAAKNSLISQKQIQDTLNVANQVNMALLGIGTVKSSAGSSIYAQDVTAGQPAVEIWRLRLVKLTKAISRILTQPPRDGG